MKSLDGLRVAMTGATGTVGAALLAELERRGCRPCAIGRRAGLRWDLREPLPAAVAARLREVDVVVHAAADIRLGAAPALLHRVNVEATEEIVRALGDGGRAPRLMYVSSAFAPESGEEPVNAYERTKAAAEAAVLGSGLDVAVVRPSLVVGARADGAIARFAGVYTVLRLLGLGMFPALPVDQSARVDIVPVDAVASAVADLVAEGWSGQRVAVLAAGASAPTARWLVDTACEVIEEHGHPGFVRPKLVSPEQHRRLLRPLLVPELSPGQRVLLETLEIFFPYLETSEPFTSSSLHLSPTEVREAWRRSVAYWMRHARVRPPVGFAAWAPRSKTAPG